ncbi:hypothetical protein ROLI_035880 [Roseobacter fucihabitans]|uniref:YdhG-like domain-containing protein n=1 Tax=Roseobacter fucihabitans TaxID=1537242 RepID=A0ABZ2BYG9_9RHOB|nr:DUF1801 domain-containing protein [Roseobacter litoralis]MBC6964550.1 hypothetical protein [Roseobacter litoralis]
MVKTAEVADFLENVMPARRHAQAQVLNALFQEVTGWRPALWQGSILGYGSYDYTYASGRSGTYLATGFAARKARLSVYIMPGYGDFGDLLVRLGKHKAGKSCLYINKLEDVDLDVLKTLIRAGLDDLGRRWPIHPT